MADEQATPHGTLQDALKGALGVTLKAPEAAPAPESQAAQQTAPESAAPAAAEKPAATSRPPHQGPRTGGGGGERNRESRPPREAGARPAGGGERGGRPGEHRGPRPGGDRPGGDRPGGERHGGERHGGGERRFDGPPEIDLDKLVGDSLYLDNQAHIVVSRLRDLDSGTRSQLRRFYNAVRRATRTPESERQHEFVMLRARLAYTIARHGLRSLDQLERLLLQVTRRNEARGYERFRDLFEAIVAYNE